MIHVDRIAAGIPGHPLDERAHLFLRKAGLFRGIEGQVQRENEGRQQNAASSQRARTITSLRSSHPLAETSPTATSMTTWGAANSSKRVARG